MENSPLRVHPNTRFEAQWSDFSGHAGRLLDLPLSRTFRCADLRVQLYRLQTCFIPLTVHYQKFWALAKKLDLKHKHLCAEIEFCGYLMSNHLPSEERKPLTMRRAGCLIRIETEVQPRLEKANKIRGAKGV